MTRETVWCETRAERATSRMVGRFGRGSILGIPASARHRTHAPLANCEHPSRGRVGVSIEELPVLTRVPALHYGVTGHIPGRRTTHPSMRRTRHAGMPSDRMARLLAAPSRMLRMARRPAGRRADPRRDHPTG